MAENTSETASGTQAVPTPAEAVAAGQIPAQTQTPPPQQQTAPKQQAAGESKSEVTDWESEATKWKALSRQHENKHLAALGFKSKDEIDHLRQAAQKYSEFEDTQKSELQRANERAQSVEQQLTEMRSTNARLMAAATHNIPPDLIDLLGSGSDEEINARAEVLAERLKANTPAPASSQRPVESLTPGAATSSGSAQATPDQWIRSMAGRNP
jgi:myosin heavy subunit